MIWNLIYKNFYLGTIFANNFQYSFLKTHFAHFGSHTAFSLHDDSHFVPEEGRLSSSETCCKYFHLHCAGGRFSKSLTTIFLKFFGYIYVKIKFEEPDLNMLLWILQ